MKCISAKRRFLDITAANTDIVISVHQPADCPCDLSNPSTASRLNISLRVFRKGTDGTTFLQYLPYGYDAQWNLRFRLDTQFLALPEGLYTGRVYFSDFRGDVPLRPDYTFRVGNRGYTAGAYDNPSRFFPFGQDENPSPVLE